MKKEERLLKVSIVTMMLFGSCAYAGKIITDADLSNLTVTKNKQFGFGGWNFDNIDVRIVNTDDFSGRDGIFYENNGTYTSMEENMSFESDIWSLDGSNTLMAHLHGKDWPVGEPAGIKIINDDNGTKHGKPENCIMTTSYIADHYLDANASQVIIPTICSSDFQTHKRFKINLLPTTVVGAEENDGWGNPVDLVFNLDGTDTNETARRYQVLQKINNYTDKRLDGYKIEVLDANKEKNDALTLSLGQGEGDNDGDIWETEDLANMSHGLWGPVDNHFPEPGFFDNLRVYYPVTLNDEKNTISYSGDMLGGNYQEIFGNWVPSIWAPKGIFWDDDNNSETDGILVAFQLAASEDSDPWYKGNEDNWVEATQEEREAWLNDPLYEEDTVEDVLNLGLNYIVNVGKNADIGDTFTIRITPHVDANQTEVTDFVPPKKRGVAALPGIIMYLLD